MNEPDGVERDYQTYKSLLELWSKENPIKTTKLQVLLAVNALLVSAVNVSGGLTAGKWYVYLAGAVFSFIGMFSIGRTSLFQDVWQIKLAELRARHRDDPRFSILETEDARRRARPMLRTFGAVSSRWYLLFSPLAFALAWLGILVVALAR
ncbi:MAG: hypothetical protein A3E31_18260 [Candidatus Rokubacteria bacterium RIFCSPHIGHO2_12_FULL_73_22]|nr:MAG: hypothetical protein A3D33_16200 [Candidatus Rokubacteria bacterium RIFCSPHIGHO2_02_FULL_73_26]OGL01318.1 MAG: hypothetical protein A3E31_18260 [Candidatus Rokubacteria bacterium RIFCSPHIGHO2_12_FULL_73_22]OGL11292.1 MAG: hypothetical protein A3I14_19000 [Candidatus Rokubacteria bacterium RIFCSPLOWO2_02_FULL_73_56]OGL26157.1 MAG: hypothetical protein A3G44_15765 [Candidatus Rokubacteria bacterium RIFCSPLOWO2_12_FULL_73_47]